MSLGGFSRVNLANLPTPLESLPRFSKKIGRGLTLYIKRDDQTGLATGGNKARKLEFLLADAIQKKADTVITASPLSPNTKFIQAMEEMVPEIYPIGDCNEPGLIKDAIAAGARVGHTI